MKHTTAQDDLERRALKLTVISGILKGLFYFILASVIWHDKASSVIIRAFFGGMILGIATEYLFYYRPNIIKHRQLRLLEGYDAEVARAISEKGLSKMLHQNWFVKQHKQRIAQSM
ncbi:MAG: hypothetical protein R3C55_10260 [Parvularculaceae bacterium]